MVGCRLGQNPFMQSEQHDWSTDRWLALLAGHTTWNDPDRRPNITVRSTGGIEMFAIICSLSTLLCFAGATRDGGAIEVVKGFPLVLMVASVICAVGPTLTLLGRGQRTRPLMANLVLRAGMGLMMVVGIFGTAPGWASLLSWPIGVAVGADASLTAYVIGWRPSPWQWWLSVISSPLHFGIVGGLVGTALASADVNLVDSVLPVYLTGHIWIVIACLAAHGTSLMTDAERARSEAIRLEAVRDEHRRSAHWLHDDICAQLRLVTLKLHRGATETDKVVAMLDELDFSLRLRQLDELLQSGSVRLAEVLQPFVRNAQNHGVTVDQVPSYETASAVVDRGTGLALRHAASVLTSNALNAGATRLSFEMSVDDDVIEVAVVDDAGGFETDAVTAGRGLWSLQHELGPDSVAIEQVDGGSRVGVCIPRRGATWEKGPARAASATR